MRQAGDGIEVGMPRTGARMLRPALARDQLLAIIGHDLRNPLQTIAVASETLLRRERNPEASKLLAAIARASGRMAELIASTLDFASGELNGGLDVDLAPRPDLEDGLRQTVDELLIVYPDANVVAEYDIRCDVICDSRAVARLFGNVLTNAIVHGDRAEPIEVLVWATEGRFRLSVSNAGPIIPAERLSTLFEPFRRYDERGAGLGLGLYIAREIADAHAGTLCVESSGGRTCVTFDFDWLPRS